MGRGGEFESFRFFADQSGMTMEHTWSWCVLKWPVGAWLMFFYRDHLTNETCQTVPQWLVVYLNGKHLKINLRLVWGWDEGNFMRTQLMFVPWASREKLLFHLHWYSLYTEATIWYRFSFSLSQSGRIESYKANTSSLNCISLQCTLL